MRSYLKFPGLWIGLFLLISGDRCIFAQNSSDLIAYFKNQSISVENILVKSKTITAHAQYQKGGEFTQDKIEKDILSIFAKLAEEFPNSNTLCIAYFWEKEKIFELELETKDALDFTKGTKTGQQMISRMGMKILLDIEKRLASEIQAESRLPADQATPIATLPEKMVEIPEEEEVEVPEEYKKVASGAAPRVWGLISPQASAWPLVGLVVFFGGSLFLWGAILVLRNRFVRTSLKVRASLDVYYSDGGRKSFIIQSSRTGIGRAPDNSLIINDPLVSTHHAEIIVSESGFLLRDLGSVNGTSLNTVNISQSPIYLGDGIRMGSTRLILGG